MSEQLCLSINAPTPEERKQQAATHDFIEVRTDLPSLSEEEIQSLCKSNTVLIADRLNGSEEQRKKLVEVALQAGAKMVDVDVEASVGFMHDVGELTKKHGAEFIVSAHNYDHTPSRQELKELLDEARSNGPKYTKLATMSHGAADNARIMALYTMYPNLIAFCMGDPGKVTRAASLFVGAPFTYVSAGSGAETAPGQLTLDEMKSVLKHLG